LNENRKLSNLIKNREAGDQLSRDLFFSPVATMTGRLRGKVGFAQSRNTPFQGLAADGAKLALWGLYPGQSHVSSMNNLRVASQLQSYPSHIAYVYLELHL
jgi:hypothetical protein